MGLPRSTEELCWTTGAESPARGLQELCNRAPEDSLGGKVRLRGWTRRLLEAEAQGAYALECTLDRVRGEVLAWSEHAYSLGLLLPEWPCSPGSLRVLAHLLEEFRQDVLEEIRAEDRHPVLAPVAKSA
jgi:hypothetical protein